METQNNSFISFAKRESLMSQEEKLEVHKSGKSLKIGLPKETSFQERRISLIPAAVKTLVENGHELVLERGAGEAAHFSDHDFAEAGANLVSTAEEVFSTEIILKVSPISMNEIQMLRGNQILLSALHLGSHSKEYFKKLIQKRMTAIAFESIKDDAGTYPIVRSMSEIAGSSSILIAAQYLSNVQRA